MGHSSINVSLTYLRGLEIADWGWNGLEKGNDEPINESQIFFRYRQYLELETHVLKEHTMAN